MPDARIAAFDSKHADLALLLFGRKPDVSQKTGALAGPGGESCSNLFTAACLAGRSDRRRWSGFRGS